MARTSQEIRENIINAGRALLGAQGISKTTIDDIASRVKMAKSSLYYYFKSKEEIFFAVVEKEAAILKSGVSDAMEKAESPSDKLHSYFITRMSLFKELSSFYAVFNDEYSKNFALIQELRKNYDNYEVDLIKGILSRGVAQGTFSISDIDLTSSTLQLILKGLEYEWATKMSEAEIPKNVFKLMDILLHGIEKRG